MTKENFKIGFIGAGSIGSLFGGYLAGLNSDKYSTEVIFFCRQSQARAINQNGLKIQKTQSFKEIQGIKAYVNEREYYKQFRKDTSSGFDYLFLTTKAYDIEGAIYQYKNLIERSRWLIVLQNGIGNEDVVIKNCSKSKSEIMRIVTANGALLSEPGRVVHTGDGITKIGFPFLEEINSKPEIADRAKLDLKIMADLLNSSNLETLIIEEIVKECWEKVFINIGINAVGALARVPNGKLLESNNLKFIMKEAIKEALIVAELENPKLPNKEYFQLALEVAKNTAENNNSMLQDILNRKATEIDFINGRILKIAEKYNIDVPINRILTYLIKGLEKTLI